MINDATRHTAPVAIDPREVAVLVRGFGRRFREDLPVNHELPVEIAALIDAISHAERRSRARS